MKVLVVAILAVLLETYTIISIGAARESDSISCSVETFFHQIVLVSRVKQPGHWIFCTEAETRKLPTLGAFALSI